VTTIRNSSHDASRGPARHPTTPDGIIGVM
jgi:hypothetical protein